MDHFAAFLSHFRLHAHTFHAGPLCQQVRYDGEGRYGFIHLLREGRLDIETEGEGVREVEAPAMIFYPRPTGHRLLPRGDAGCDLVCAAIGFGVGARNPVLDALPAVVVMPFSQLAELRLALALLFEEAGQARAGRQAILDRVTEVIVIQALRHVAESGMVRQGVLAGLADARLARALTALHESPARPWSVADLAACAGMSRARFAVRFRNVLGQTPADYLLQWRIILAKTLLRRGKPLKLIANEVGYATAPSFTRAFSKVVGLPPSAWLAGADRVQATGGS